MGWVWLYWWYYPSVALGLWGWWNSGERVPSQCMGELVERQRKKMWTVRVKDRFDSQIQVWSCFVRLMQGLVYQVFGIRSHSSTGGRSLSLEVMLMPMLWLAVFKFRGRMRGMVNMLCMRCNCTVLVPAKSVETQSRGSWCQSVSTLYVGTSTYKVYNQPHAQLPESWIDRLSAPRSLFPRQSMTMMLVLDSALRSS